MKTVDILICPTTGEEVMPIKVWESRLPNGKVVHYGQLQRHVHVGQECEWSHLVQPLVSREDSVSLFIL